MTHETVQRNDQFRFSHDDGVMRHRTDQITSTTRYLSGAAYIDASYADRVIDELVAASHRAVVPSVGYDVTTVVRHCFRAQKLWLVQHSVVTALLVAGLVISYQATLACYALCFLLAAVVPDPDLSRRRMNWKVVAVVVVVLVLLACAAGPLLSLLRASSGLALAADATGTGDSGSGGGPTGARFWICLLFLVVGILITLSSSRRQMLRIVTTDLCRGAPSRASRPLRKEVEQRLRVVDTAQHGNVLLHSGFNPFVGAGVRANTWSMATPLLLDEDLEPEDLTGGHADPNRPRRRVEIDPVELIAHVRRGLAALRSTELPPQERVTGLQLRDQVISSGTRWVDDPLIDAGSRLPYSHANREALDAIIRFPQTSARHFLRATVGAPDKAAVDSTGRAVLPGEHQGVVSSTYLHVAIEGGMLYVELVTTALGPIRKRYLDIDRYGTGSDAPRGGPTFGEVMQRFPQATMVAPLGMIGGLLKHSALTSAIYRADKESGEEATYDFGAHLDVRELASIRGYATYLQRLDGEKYSKLIERRATDSIFTFLTSKGVDTSDYRAKVSFRQYNTTTIEGDSFGSVATGGSSTATTTTVVTPAGTTNGGEG